MSSRKILNYDRLINGRVWLPESSLQKYLPSPLLQQLKMEVRRQQIVSSSPCSACGKSMTKVIGFLPSASIDGCSACHHYLFDERGFQELTTFMEYRQENHGKVELARHENLAETRGDDEYAFDDDIVSTLQSDINRLLFQKHRNTMNLMHRSHQSPGNYYLEIIFVIIGILGVLLFRR